MLARRRELLFSAAFVNRCGYMARNRFCKWRENVTHNHR